MCDWQPETNHDCNDRNDHSGGVIFKYRHKNVRLKKKIRVYYNIVVVKPVKHASFRLECNKEKKEIFITRVTLWITPYTWNGRIKRPVLFLVFHFGGRDEAEGIVSNVVDETYLKILKLKIKYNQWIRGRGKPSWRFKHRGDSVWKNFGGIKTLL